MEVVEDRGFGGLIERLSPDMMQLFINRSYCRYVCVCHAVCEGHASIDWRVQNR